MGLTPDDIRTREFSVGLRGFDTQEVRSFLEEAARSYEDAMRVASEPPSPEALADLVGEEVRRVLLSASAAAAAVHAQAEAQSADMASEARARAEAAEHRALQLQLEVAHAAAQLRNDCSALIQSALTWRDGADAAVAGLQEAVEAITVVANLVEEIGEPATFPPASPGADRSPGSGL